MLIVEDEIPAQINLKKLIDKHCTNSVVVSTLSSVRSAIKWLEGTHGTERIAGRP